MSAPDVPPPRRPFEHLRDRPAQSFTASPEFQRILWFGGLLLFVGLAALYMLTTKAKSEAPRETAPAVAVAPATPEELAAKRERLFGLFEGSLADAGNGQDFAETSGYRRLLSLVAGYSSEDFHAKTQRWLDYESAKSQPDLWRGEFVRVRGIVAWMGAQKLSRSTLGITDVWRGAVTDAEGEQAVIIDLVNPPPGFDQRREAIDVEGVFYRTVGYETVERGNPKLDRGRVVVPYLIARNFAVVETKPSPTGFLHDNAVATLVAMAVVFGLTRLVMYWFQRKKQRRAAPRTRVPATDFHAMFEKHRRAQERPTDPRPPSA